MGINIKGQNKAVILAALYNNSAPQRLGFLHYTENDMTEAEAQELLDSGQTYFDYVHGRVMKIDLSGDELRTELYDRDIGNGECERVVASISA